MVVDKALVGSSGEYYIAFRLSAAGYPVGLTARGSRSADLLFTNLDSGKSLTIQVKAMMNAHMASKKWGAYWKWRVGINRASPKDSFYYLFTDLRDDPTLVPHVFMVPSLNLQPLLEEYPAGGPKITDAWCNIYEKDKDMYLDRWDLIHGALS